jgi:hypothetical protein
VAGRVAGTRLTVAGDRGARRQSLRERRRSIVGLRGPGRGSAAVARVSRTDKLLRFSCRVTASGVVTAAVPTGGVRDRRSRRRSDRRARRPRRPTTRRRRAPFQGATSHSARVFNESTAGFRCGAGPLWANRSARPQSQSAAQDVANVFATLGAAAHPGPHHVDVRNRSAARRRKVLK